MPELELDGVCIHYEVDGEGPPVVLIMGLGLGAAAWAWTRLWLEQGHRVIAIDNRGSGASTCRRRPLSTSRMADDVAAVLQAVGEDSAHVYGLSLGGMIAQELALRHPQRVRSLILGCTLAGGLGSTPPDLATLSCLLAASAAGARMRARAMLGLSLSAGYRRGRWVLRQDAEELVSALLGDVRGYRLQLAAAWGHAAWRRLDRIAAPTLVVHGSADRIVPPANGQALARRIPGARLVLLEGAGHAYEIEQPHESRAAVSAFLDEHRDRQPAVTEPVPHGGMLPARLAGAAATTGVHAIGLGVRALRAPLCLSRLP